MASILDNDSKRSSVRKLALVIGIGQYADWNDLPNAINDAVDVTDALKQIGFQIDKPQLNLTCRNIKHILIDFEDSLKTGDLVLFYFSGHGTQWEDQNYLIPSDNLGINGIDLRTRAINAQDILDRINGRKPLATIFILDCCRKYHLRNTDLDRRDRAIAIHQPKGLREMSNEHESLVVFACAAGATADDQKTGRNGLFTKHLLRHIHSPNEHVQMMLFDVISGVKQESKSQQIPYVYSSLSNKRLFLNQTTLDQNYSNLFFKQNATTIAAGNGYGSNLNQLKYPQGIYVDDQQQSIYVADHYNHRIVKWKFGENNGQLVAGGNGYGNRIDQLFYPTDVIVDQNNKSLIICDFGNRRVVRWSLENQQDKQIIIQNIHCWGLMMNDNGDLFVSDWNKDEVKRWRKGEKEGTVVAGGNGKGDQLNQLNWPTFIFIDRQDAVYVSDSDNHRVMKWVKGAKEGIVVAGGQGQGNSFKQLDHPQGLIVNEVGDVYVADWDNHRIMCRSSESKEGRLVVGGNGSGQGSNQFNGPVGLSFDGLNNLYVVDYVNNRIQRFSVDKKKN